MTDITIRVQVASEDAEEAFGAGSLIAGEFAEYLKQYPPQRPRIVVVTWNVKGRRGR